MKFWPFKEGKRAPIIYLDGQRGYISSPRPFARGAAQRPIVKSKPAPKIPGQKTNVTMSRTFDAAVQTRLNFGWTSEPIPYDQEIRQHLASLRGWSRDLEQNNDHVRRFYQVLNQGVIFRGIWPVPGFRDPRGNLRKDLNDLIFKTFKAWGRVGNCDVTGRLSWVDILRITLQSIVRDGEAFVRVLQGGEFGEYEFQLQLIDAMYVDHELNQEQLQGGNRIVMGVELNQWNKPVAYYVRQPKTTAETVSLGSSAYLRIPKEEMIHVFRQERPMQTRGVPWLRNENLGMAARYMQAALAASEAAAGKMGFYVNRNEEDEGQYGQQKVLAQEVYPGGMEMLPPGWEVQTVDFKHPNEQFDPFIKAIIRSIAAGMGISYGSLSGDLERATYSSLRHAMLDERDFFRVIQEFMIESFCRPIFKLWMEEMILSRVIQIPPAVRREYLDVPWISRSYPWVDPQKDMKEKTEGISYGLMSKTEVIRERGRVYDDVLDEIKQERALEDQAGIIFKDRDGLLDDIPGPIGEEADT